MNYRIIEEHKIDRALFRGFNRRQEVTLCRRRKGGEWVIEPDPFVDDWSEEDYRELTGHMKDLSLRGGFVYGAMQSNVLKGFVTVDAKALGPDNEYLDLRDLFVSADARGQGIGRELFRAAAQWARSKGACNFTSRHIRPSKPRRFARLWAALTRNTSACGTSKKNRTTANSNTPSSQTATPMRLHYKPSARLEPPA
ncbi:GNAT family N-acetyltransferase [Slackia sp.]|uniref:GNAT family N-acetyltransferase n=1 Tax=Slackia sp. TaxID=2049041 RepID=UPI00399B8DFC